MLDSEQNYKFRDHYLEVPVDLSEVLFVTTANSLQTIPRPLLDRMEIIEISSYTENEKEHIADRHLIPKQLERHGLSEEQLQISKNAVGKMIRSYTKEAGVRQLERKIGAICRKSAKEILEKDRKKIRVTEKNIEKYLGKEIFTYEMANETDEVGIVRGLAWTSVGGDTLQIEVNVLSGKGKLLLTGQMGDVMKESAMLALEYIHAHAAQFNINEELFENWNVHVHVPEGAIPKDGPSAGITMVTSLVSAFTQRKVKKNLAMTGEITLRGKVLPVGGIKEKILAAKRAGIKELILCKENEKDINEIKPEYLKGLVFHYVSDIQQVVDLALLREKVDNPLF